MNREQDDNLIWILQDEATFGLRNVYEMRNGMGQVRHVVEIVIKYCKVLVGKWVFLVQPLWGSKRCNAL